jgi:putative oxidoreductase
MSMIAAIIGRLLLAALFIVSGLQKLVDPGPTAAMLEATNLPANFALPTGLFRGRRRRAARDRADDPTGRGAARRVCCADDLLLPQPVRRPLQATLALKNLASSAGC